MRASILLSFSGKIVMSGSPKITNRLAAGLQHPRLTAIAEARPKDFDFHTEGLGELAEGACNEVVP
jgi:hypothetical protein